MSVLSCIIFLIFNNIMHISRFYSIGWPNIFRCMCLPNVHYLLPLGLFLYLVILHNAAMTMGVKIPMDLLFFSFEWIPRSGDIRWYGNKVFFLQRLYVCVLCVLCVSVLARTCSCNGEGDPERVWPVSTVHSVFFQECNHFISPNYVLFITLMIMGICSDWSWISHFLGNSFRLLPR